MKNQNGIGGQDLRKIKTHFIMVEKPNEFYVKRTGEAVDFRLPSPQAIDWDEQLIRLEAIVNFATPYQKERAKYWGSTAPVQDLYRLFRKLSSRYQIPFLKSLKMMAALGAAVNDMFIISYALKMHYKVPRPQGIQTSVARPNSHSYPSAHSAIAGCLETLLGHYFPYERPLFNHYAEECANSRLYAGVHFPADVREGYRIGREFGEIAAAELGIEDPF